MPTEVCVPRKTPSIPCSQRVACSNPQTISARAHIGSVDEYERLYREAINNPAKFWGGIASELHWFKPWDKVLEWDCPWAKWFSGGQINLSYNCLDRHVATARRNKAALIWEGEPGEVETLTYQQLLTEVCKFANVLKIAGTFKRATAWPSTWGCAPPCPSPCWPARASARRTPSSSEAFRPRRWWTASTTRRRLW